MKIKHIVIAISALLALQSCSEMLNYNETVDKTEESIFSSFTRCDYFVRDIYAHMESGFTTLGYGAMLASACDEAEIAWPSSNVRNFYNGAWSSINPMTSAWSANYEGIRAANKYLEKTKGRTFDDYKNNKNYAELMDKFNRSEYEVRFLRAYFYFQLVKTFGDVPLVLTVLNEKQANSVSRAPASDIFKFIVDECDAVYDTKVLPYNYAPLPGNETGRITQQAVLALKARALMYAASPLFNPSNDNQLWRKAAVACKKAIDESVANGAKLNAYTAIWGADNYKNTEVLLARRIGDMNSFESQNFPIGVEGGSSGNCPTQTLVDAYEMAATGKLWNEEGSGFDPVNPYNKRDPRFAMTIAHNGVTKWPNYNTGALETYIGGKNALPIPGGTPSGYYLRKYCDASVDLRPNSTNKKRHSWVIFRLGELYLNYAECVFRTLGSADATDPDFAMTARQAVNQIRGRAGVKMPDFPAGISNPDFERRYISERMVELAFEEQRFWDIRRWKRGDLAAQVTLTTITYEAETNTYLYTRRTRDRMWDNKMLLFPIPNSECLKNSNLTQNTGW